MKVKVQQAPTTLKAWLMAARPKTLFASLTPVILGLSLSYGHSSFNLEIALVTAITAILLQVATNFVNDYYDAVSGIDGDNRLGPQRVTQSGLISPERVKIGFMFSFAVAFLLGLKLMTHGGLIIVAIGLLSILFAYIYTGGPIPLSHMALGEVLAFLFFGPVATFGTYYLQTLNIDPLAILVGFAPGCFSASLMAVNNLRDRESDKLTNKTTLATLLPMPLPRIIPIGFAVLGFFMPVVLYFYYGLSMWVLISLIAIIPYIKTFKALWRSPIDKSLNIHLAQTGKVLFIQGLLFSFGLTL